MKKFLAKILIFFLVGSMFLALIAVPSIYYDPFNVFHWENIRNLSVEPNKNYIKTKYILNNPQKYDAFLFGSSRVGAIHVEKISTEKVYNMTYSAGVPVEHLETLEEFLNGGVIPKTIYMGVDSLSYRTNPTDHYLEQLRSPYSYLKSHPDVFIELYITNTAVLKQIIRQITQHSSDSGEMPGYQTFYDYGWWFDYGDSHEFDVENAQPSFAGDIDRLDKTISEIEKIAELCKEHNIKLVVFTNPMYDVTYKASIDRDYFEFLTKLVDITDFYNFSSLNTITTDPSCYLDTSHYTAEVGDIIIDTICHDFRDETLYQQGFGWHVTKENIDELIALLKSQIP